MVAPVVGGAFLVLLPGSLLASRGWRLAPMALRVPGAAVIAAGLVVVVWAIREFAVTGHGTPFPVDPPRELVTRGPYRYVHNPMALGVVTTILGEAALFGSLVLAAYGGGALVAIHLMVVGYEEPANRRRFGGAYDGYCAAVRRWIPATPSTPPDVPGV